MKRPVKISLIAAGSVLGVLLLAVVILSLVLFNGKNLSSLILSQLNRQEKLEFTLDNADLVFFRTFPELSVHIENFGVHEKSGGDTLARVEDLFAAIDVRAFLRDEELAVRKIALEDCYADISEVMAGLPSDTAAVEKDEKPSDLPFGLLNLSLLTADNLHLIYGDPDGFRAESEGLNFRLNLRSDRNGGHGKLKLKSPVTTVSVGDTVYCDHLPLALVLPFQADFSTMNIMLEESHLQAADFRLDFQGRAALPEDGRITGKADLSFEDWKLSEAIAIAPDLYKKTLRGIPLDASVSLEASASLDLAGKGRMDLCLKRLSAVSGKNEVLLSGQADDLTGSMNLNLDLHSSLDLPEVSALLPDSLRIRAQGRADLNARLRGNLDQVLSADIQALSAHAECHLSELDAVYADTVHIAAPELKLSFSSPAGKIGKVGLDLCSLDLTAGRKLYAILTGAGINVDFSALPEKDRPLTASCDYVIEGFQAEADTLGAAATGMRGSLFLGSSAVPGRQQRYSCSYTSEALSLNMGDSLTLDAHDITIAAASERDTAARDFLAQWNPELKVDFQEGLLQLPQFPDPVEIPAVRLSYAEDTLRMQESRFYMGNSDFRLSGTAENISRFSRNEGLLKADFDFISEKTDVDQLMDYFSGMGSSPADSAEVEELSGLAEEDPEDEGDPFMVPKGIDLTLDTDIRTASAFGNMVSNVGGKITVKDGEMLIRQLGFTSDAARMQLTGMYKSPRKNHLYAGLDFHLMDIEIDRLISMIPKVDSVLPMLKSFAGQAEFHLAVETNLDSRYQLKKSTLIGAASIEGKNLVVLDSETFDEISRMLLFKKSQKNIIDSLAVDLTVFRNEVDIYPFVVSMDKYKLILSGRHNLDMSFNYHFDCLSPIRLGLDVKGKMGDLKFKLTPTRYKNLFKPERRNDVQKRTLKFMDMINSSLKEKVAD